MNVNTEEIEVSEDINLSDGKDIIMREILHRLTSVPLDMTIMEKSKGGDVKFSIDLGNMGFTKEMVDKYMGYICSDFFANFVGELVIRENINKFAKLLMSINKNDYSSVVNDFEHRKFGMEVYGMKIIFWFHLSLLQNIMVEDFKKEIKSKSKKKQI